MASSTKRGEKTAQQLVIQQNSPLRVLKNDADVAFFICGEVKGYCSPNAYAAAQEGRLGDLQYAEWQKEDGEWIPCLMVVPSGGITLGAELLR